ncbi:hypothetical protein Y1Q_0000959 [Alligator mississippiensis]|uniref:Uncharacterized protein n=1 Tax=Alligator mississippiensis TaxID=8496 RepID=A0A151NE27_ALLMI|nr:hypothetical protein Y1Q_0000959 [Alligator mississippiensis]
MKARGLQSHLTLASQVPLFSIWVSLPLSLLGLIAQAVMYYPVVLMVHTLPPPSPAPQVVYILSPPHL